MQTKLENFPTLRVRDSEHARLASAWKGNPALEHPRRRGWAQDLQMAVPLLDKFVVRNATEGELDVAIRLGVTVLPEWHVSPSEFSCAYALDPTGFYVGVLNGEIISLINCIKLVSCPASLSHAEKESGETRIQFWFRAARSRRVQSDCRTVLRHQEKIAMLHRALCTSVVGDGYM